MKQKIIKICGLNVQILISFIAITAVTLSSFLIIMSSVLAQSNELALITPTLTSKSSISAVKKDQTKPLTGSKDINTSNIAPSNPQYNDDSSSSLSFMVTTLGNYTGTHTVIAGANNAELLYYNLRTLGAGANIDYIRFAGYIDGDGTGTLMYFNHDGNNYVQDVVSSLRLYVLQGQVYTQIGSVASFSNGYVTFNNLNLRVVPGQIKTLVLKGNIGYSINPPKRLAFDIFNTVGNYVNISARGDNGQIIPTIIAQRNGSGGSLTNVMLERLHTIISVVNSGNLYSSDNGSPVSSIALAGTNNYPVLRLRFNAVNDSYRIDRLRIDQLVASTSRSVNGVTITYPHLSSNGNIVTMTSEATLSPYGVAIFNLGIDNDIYVPNNGQANVDVSANLNPISPSMAQSNDQIAFRFDHLVNFEAIGQVSTLHQTNVDVTGNTDVVHATAPLFSAETLSNTGLIEGINQPIYQFSVTAAGNQGLSVGLKKINLRTSITGGAMSIRSLRLYENGTELTAGFIGSTYSIYDGIHGTMTNGRLDAGGTGSLGTGTDQNMFIVFNSARMINAGETKHYRVEATVRGVSTAGISYTLNTYLSPAESNYATNTYLTAMCPVNSPDGFWSKFCLTNSNHSNYSAAGYIWSDETGTNGNGNNIDVDFGAGNSSGDWFNSFLVRNLGLSQSETLTRFNQ